MASFHLQSQKFLIFSQNFEDINWFLCLQALIVPTEVSAVGQVIIIPL